ncbi:prephenate dehydrogenase (NADP(+)), partial [Tulasnella sp. 417]
LMIEGDEEGLRKRVYRARDIVFDDEYREGIQKEPVILSEKMLLIGVAEYIFRDTVRLEAAIHTAAHDPTHRSDDVEYVIAARGWSQCVIFGSFELYERRFKETASFFEHRFADANKLGAQMIKAILEGEQTGSGRN